MSSGYAFCGCVLDPSCYELSRKGKPVRIEPKVFDVLLALIEGRERVLSKQELLDGLWPGEAVSDSVLPRCIAAARRAVGDTRSKQKIIQTVHGRGYRFVASLDPSPDARGGASADPGNGPMGPRTAEPHSSPETQSGREIFVGRQAALERLEEALQRAHSGRSWISLLVGEPGIGKTATAQQLAVRANALGFETLTGRCYEGDGAPAYWPWVQVLREAIANSDLADLREQCDGIAGELAEIAPELASRIGSAPGPQGPRGDQARFRLYDAVTRFLAKRSEQRPLFILLDDLHWADASSLGLLRFMANHLQRERVIVCATYRDVEVRRGHPLAEVLGELARSGRCDRIALDGLDEVDIRSLTRAVTGTEPNAEVASRLLEMTEGNPFFVHEIVRLLADGGELQAGARALDSLVLPQGVRDAIGRRLDRLSADCNKMLRIAAVIGREFQGHFLEAWVESEDEFFELVGEALDAGVIVEGTRGSYGFSHALIRQTLYEELRAPQRIALHRRIGEALEASTPEPSDDRLTALAHHFFEAAPGGDLDRAIDYCQRAAAAALRQHAYDEAATHHERALDALEADPNVDPERRAELTLALAQAHFIAGRRNTAREYFHATAQLARRIGRTDLLARAAIELRGFGEMGGIVAPEDVELLVEALAATPENEITLRSRLLSRMTGTGPKRMSERREFATQAMTLARQSGDPLAMRDALSACWWASLGPDHIEERFSLVRELRALADSTDDVQILLLSLEFELGVSLVVGDRDAIERILSDYERIASELRQPLFIFMAMMFRSGWLLTTGAFAEADALLHEAHAFGQGVVPFADMTYVGQLHWSRIHRGASSELAESAEDLQNALADYFQNVPAAALFTLLIYSNHEGQVERTRESVASLDYRNLDRDEHWLIGVGILCDAAYQLEDRELLEWLEEVLQPYSELMGVHDLLRASTGSVAAYLGEVTCGLGRYDEAVAWYEKALRKESEFNALPAVISSHFGLARALRARGAAGDDERAEREAASGEALAQRIGSKQASSWIADTQSQAGRAH